MKHFAKNIIIRRLNSKVKNLFEKNEITVIGVTGSVGKTSAKHAIGEVLAASHKVRYSQDSYNTDIGIPPIYGTLEPGKNCLKKLIMRLLIINSTPLF